MSFWILFPLLIIEIAVLGFMIVKIFTQNKIADIKSTKYFIPTLFINLAVYLIAVLQTQTSGFFETFLITLESGTKACFLGVDSDLILPLMQTSSLFSAVFTLSYVISVFTFVYVFIALVGRSISNFFKVIFINLSKKEKVVIIGFNDDTSEFYKSIKNTQNIIFWVPEASKDDIKTFLSNKKFHFVFDKINEKSFGKFSRGSTLFISFLNDDKQNLELLDIFGKIKSDDFKLFVSVDSNFENTFRKYFMAYNVNFFNKYNLIAHKFIMENPISSLLKKENIDTKTATIKEEVNINVFLMGYGEVNRAIFHNMAIDNQFLTLDKNGKYVHKKVNYFLFDKREYMGDKNFSFNSFRYLEAVEKLDKKEYFELPEKPFEPVFKSADLNSKNFYTSLREILNGFNRENTFNMIVTAFSSDLENIDQTVRFKQTFEEMGFDDNIFFTRLRSKTYLPIIKAYGNVNGFGEYGILDYDTIICDKLNQFSIDRNFQLCLKDAEVLEIFEGFNRIRSVKKQLEETEKYKLKLWKQLEPVIKDYNKYQSINLRTKLNLLGLDTIGSEQVTNKTFYEKYDTLKEIVENNRHREYKMPYPNTLSPRNILARQEQLHTIAFLISQGYLPMKKQEIEKIKINEVLVNTKTRTALRLTTFDGLDAVYETRLTALKPNKQDLVFIDPKKELYQTMDDVPLHKYSNYLIYKKEDRK